jgi:hypothetical protein
MNAHGACTVGHAAGGYDSGESCPRCNYDLRAAPAPGVPGFTGNHNLNRDTGFQPVLGVFDLQPT